MTEPKMKRWVRSKNPVRLFLGDLRYRAGLWVQDRTEGPEWVDKSNKLRYRIWLFGADSETRQNCIQYPFLGKIIKWEQKEHATRAKWSEMYYNQDPRSTKLRKKLQHYTDRKEALLKEEDPKFETRLERQARDRRELEEWRAHKALTEDTDTDTITS